MVDNGPSATNHADESQRAESGGSNIRIHLIASDPKYISAIALAVSVLCAFYAFEAGHTASQAEYFMQRSEGFLEQLSNQGVKVPCDLRPHNKECKP